MGTLEKSPGSSEFDTGGKRFVKNLDFPFRTAPDHAKEALWPKTRKLLDFGAKIVRIDIKSARMNAFWCQSLPYSIENWVQKVCKTVESTIFAENPRWGP